MTFAWDKHIFNRNNSETVENWLSFYSVVKANVANLAHFVLIQLKHDLCFIVYIVISSNLFTNGLPL